MTESGTTYDCLACGACCHAGPNYVLLYEEDLVVLRQRGAMHLTARSTLEVPRAGETGEELYMRSESGHCVALDPVPGRWACTIYEDRPLLCRVFEPGSKPCLEARARRSIR